MAALDVPFPGKRAARSPDPHLEFLLLLYEAQGCLVPMKSTHCSQYGQVCSQSGTLSF